MLRPCFLRKMLLSSYDFFIEIDINSGILIYMVKCVNKFPDTKFVYKFHMKTLPVRDYCKYWETAVKTINFLG